MFDLATLIIITIMLIIFCLVLWVGYNVPANDPIRNFDPIRTLDSNAKALVLSCMDFRFIGPTINYLYNRNQAYDFDYFVLAGASLGYNESKESYSTEEIPNKVDQCWHEAYEDHIRLAQKLHNITEIIVIDHMDCGYYRAIYEIETPQQEMEKHQYNIHKFIQTLKSDPEFSIFKYTGILVKINSEPNMVFEVLYEDH